MTIPEAHASLTAPGEFFETEQRVIRGVDCLVWKNAPTTLRDVFLAGRTHGERTFLVYEDERATFEGFARAVAVFSRELIKLGVRKGDRIAIAMRNLPEWPVAFYGAALAGAIVTPLNAWWTGNELIYGLVDCGAKVLVADDERFQRIVGRLHECSDLEQIYVARAASASMSSDARLHALKDIIGGVGDWASLPDYELPNVVLAPEDDLTIFYTSGTTGKPKGALGTHRNMMSTLMAGAFINARAKLRQRSQSAQAEQGTPPPKALLLGVPLFHVIACHGTLTPALFGGAKLVLMRKWDAELALQLIERERITDTGGVPTNALQLLMHPSRAHYDLSSLASLSFGGASSRPELVDELNRAFPQTSPFTGWGMTETSGAVAGHCGEDLERRPTSCGAPIAVCEMKVVGPQGETLPAGEVGELFAKGPNIVKGYWHRPQETAESFVDGWVRTGDLARLDEEGFCYIVDRVKDVIIRGGENIYCVEVENVLQGHPAVAEAALVPIPHEVLGEQPGAIVHLRPGAFATEQDLQAFAASQLASFKVPARIEFRTEPLPRSALGKVLKRDLAQTFIGKPAAT
jgi:long-chain acyl-CoA synthetase